MAIEFDLVIDDVSNLLEEISEATNSFEREAGYSCRAGCGQCCLKPTVEAQVVEMLPMAQHLIDLGIADEIYDRALQAEEDSCILYVETPGNPGMGRCGHYQARPSLCRLFGFAAVNKKSGPPELSTCQWHKALHPEKVKAAQEKVNAGGSVPLFSDFTMQVHNLSPASSWGFRHPINRALRMALEKLMMSRQYSQ